MRKNPSITVAEMVPQLGLSRRGVNKKIAKLKAVGVIEREGSHKNRQWIVNNKGDPMTQEKPLKNQRLFL